MKQAIFITGFNNWGKSSIIQNLFNRKRFNLSWHFRIHGVNTEFTVESQSNDDYWGDSWSDKVQERLDAEVEEDLNLFAALCPTMHPNNNFVDLLSKSPFTNYSRLHIFLIEYKWEHHAKLITKNIINEGQRIPNVNFITINADQNLILDPDRFNAKIGQIKNELARIFP